MTVIDQSRSDTDAVDATCTCPACGASGAKVFFALEDVPTNSCILLRDPAEAKAYPTGQMRLAFCPACGFVFNAAFDPACTEYSGRYEETQAFSGTFNAFHEGLVDRLIDRHSLRGKKVMEIGCGKGEFLALLAERGDNVGVGVDPGVDPGRIPASIAERLTLIPAFYADDHADPDVDFLACKMTLEHIPDVQRFLMSVRRGLGDATDTIVFFQIPEALRILRNCHFEDIYYEHCGYFTPGSLARVFRAAGFEPTTLDIEYDDQYLTIEARPRPAGGTSVAPLAEEEAIAAVADLVATFPERCGETLDGWRNTIARARADGRSIVLWGSGSKAVSFLTTLGLDDEIAAVTDINPRRHHHFMPKTAHEIVPPAQLAEIEPDLVIVMNRVYEAEIRRDLAALGVTPEVLCL